LGLRVITNPATSVCQWIGIFPPQKWEIENETLETPFLFIGKIDGFR
jgi:hypothetical protein